MTEPDHEMAANVQVLYPEYCAILQKEAEVKGYQRGYHDKIARYEEHIDQQEGLIGKLTAACEKLREEITLLQNPFHVKLTDAEIDDQLERCK